MAVSVITDSAAALPAAVAKDAGVTVVPMGLTMGRRALRDGELDLEEVLATPEVVTTSGPSPGDMLEAMDSNSGPEGAVVLTIASTMSSTYGTAQVAARLARNEVRVVDTTSAAGGQGLVVLAAAARARAGASLEEVESVAISVAQRVQLIAYLESLDHLVRSGRVPGIAAWASRSVRFRPLFVFKNGAVRPLMPALGEASAIGRIVAAWRESKPDKATAHVAALHALAPTAAEELLQAVRAEAETITAFVGPFSPVMAVHTGPGLVGLAWWWEELQ